MVIKMTNQPQKITLNFIQDIKTRAKRVASFLDHKIIINPNVFPAATEICNNLDDDCDNITDYYDSK